MDFCAAARKICYSAVDTCTVVGLDGTTSTGRWIRSLDISGELREEYGSAVHADGGAYADLFWLGRNLAKRSRARSVVLLCCTAWIRFCDSNRKKNGLQP